MASPGNPAQQLAGIWRQLGLNQKVSIVLVGVGSAAALLAMVYWGGRPSYGLLYSGLSRKDAAAVIAQLDGDGIPYRLQDNGTTILVPTDRVQQARAALLQQGIPAGSEGFEILDKQTIGLTDFAERKTYLRALQGELARTISQMDLIEGARVHITLPEPSVFVEQDRPATASVLLQVRRGAKLSPSQVAAIASFVAGSVEGLEPQSVTITDQFLNRLTRPSAEEGPGVASAHLEAQREVETYLRKKVQDMLDAFLGEGRSAVSVAADIALKHQQVHSIKFQEEGRVAKREKTMTSKSEGAGASAGGPAGAAANLPGGATATTTTPPLANSESTEEFEYEVPREETTSIDQGVTIKRLTVSVLVAGNYKVEKDAEGKETKTFVPLPEAEMQKLTEAVKQAVGYDESRKDSVSVECVEFKERQPVLPPEVLAGDQRWGLILKVAKHASTVVVLGAFLLVVRSMLKKARAAREAREAELAAAREAQARQAAAAAQRTGQVSLRERVGAAVAANPDAAADLLKAWYKGVGTTSQAE